MWWHKSQGYMLNDIQFAGSQFVIILRCICFRSKCNWSLAWHSRNRHWISNYTIPVSCSTRWKNYQLINNKPTRGNASMFAPSGPALWTIKQAALHSYMGWEGVVNPFTRPPVSTLWLLVPYFENKSQSISELFYSKPTNIPFKRQESYKYS